MYLSDLMSPRHKKVPQCPQDELVAAGVNWMQDEDVGTFTQEEMRQNEVKAPHDVAFRTATAIK